MPTITIKENNTQQTDLNKLNQLQILIENSLNQLTQNLADFQNLCHILQECDIDPALRSVPFRCPPKPDTDWYKTLLQADANYLENQNSRNGKISTLSKRSNSTKNLLLELNIDNIDIDAMVDTGATLDYMSEEFCNHLLKHHRNCKIEPCNLKVRAANGTLIESIGSINLSFSAKGRSFKTKFIVLKSLTNPIILGLEFGEKYRMCIDLFSSNSHFTSIFRNMGKFKF